MRKAEFKISGLPFSDFRIPHSEFKKNFVLLAVINDTLFFMHTGVCLWCRPY
jgi:hypothetical protein